jgi:accessory gene regulator protein AgrB
VGQRVTLATCDEVFKCAACEVKVTKQYFAVVVAAIAFAPAYYRAATHVHTELCISDTQALLLSVLLLIVLTSVYLPPFCHQQLDTV